MALTLRPLKPEIFPGGTFRVPSGERVFRVGRDRENDLCVDHVSVSASHAKLIADEDGVEVVDLGSSNGTFVNGIRVDRRRLSDGDLLRFATAEFRVSELVNGSAVPTNNGGEPVEPETDENDSEESVRLVALNEEKEALKREIVKVLEEGRRTKEEHAALRAEHDRRDAEAVSLAGQVRELGENLRRLERQLSDAGQREERLLANLSEARREVIDREGVIAGLRYEAGKQEGKIGQLEEQRARLQSVCDDYETAYNGALSDLAGTRAELEVQGQAKDAADARYEGLLDRLSRLGACLVEDWKRWMERSESGEHGDNGSGFSPEAGEEVIFSSVESLAARIRGELDLIEPIWLEFGAGVQAELAARCEALRSDQADLEGEIDRRQEELAKLEADLASFRELMDTEVRRAQGLSRRGIEVEIPERFEAMVIAKDREQEIYRSLIDRLEVLDQLLEGYRRSRKLREVSQELTAFRNRFVSILEGGGVRPFEVEVGTFLTPRHRKEVQVLSRKGWGTRQYSEHPFQPGEVVSVVRPGFRVGEGESAVILRKVEVVIREVTG
ncbi:MAG: FHA domain-containing protein [Verrucomicrobiae bacterium]|nr:FHA domain-containing protein [Verrucomicrobiae bacterium]